MYKIIKMSTISINQSIIDSINASEGDWQIIAYDNDYSLFQIVFYVLKSVVPLSEESAYKKTMEIHTKGFAIIYEGSLSHCERIGDALSKIKVKSDIIKV